jgi:small subunit ribosomal protein S1
MDPDQSQQTPGQNSEPEQSFAELLHRSESNQPRELRSGDTVTGTIIQIGEVDSFVDCGGRCELVMATAELQDDSGVLRCKEGDTITGHVQILQGEPRLTLALDLSRQDITVLQQACQNGTPVAGTVREINKGGFTVDLSGRRAFCPFSQIDLIRVEHPEEYLGCDFSFRILELSEDGRNIVLSRRVLLQEERDRRAAETLATLAPGEVVSGRVTRLAPFGAFVDLGGVEGLIHVSEISHQRVGDPGDILRVGEDIKVKVLEIQKPGQDRRERISLSLKALATDPWPETARRLQIGTDMTGRITRLMDFGAFVELQPGVEGLVHISELATRRIRHPREIVQENETVTVRILDVDVDRRRISLSLKGAASWTGEDES